jgi:hypothetical protein
LFCLLFALGTGVAQEAPPMGAVSGRVVHGMTGEAVAKALVTLSTERGAVQAMTGADGAFRIPAAPGEYRLSATRNGFLRAAYRTRVKVEAGQTVSGIEFRMSPQSVVAGRVVDEDGDPVERAFVALVPARGSRAAARLGPSPGVATNDLGEFRLAGVAPGRYYLVARREGSFLAPGSAQEYGYPATYYPSAREESSAAPVVVLAGQDATGLTIVQRRTTMQRIRGRVQGTAPGGGREGYQVMVTTGGAGMAQMGRGGFAGGGGRVRGDGAFETAGLPPGSYTLLVVQFGQGAPVVVGRTTVQLSDRPVENLVLFAGAPLTVQGQMRTDTGSPADWTKVRVMLGGAGLGIVETTGKPDGTFVLARVGRDVLPVSVTAPPGTYLKAITLGGQPVPRMSLDLTAGEAAAPVEILFGTKPAVVSGQVTGAKGGLVWLTGPMPNAPVVAAIDEQGRFRLGGLAPGEYQVLALETAEMVAEMDEERQRQMQNRLTAVKVGEGETATVSLPLVTQKEFEGRP